jgi:hypothetical protein
MNTMSPEDRLSRAFAFDEPPARDFGFTLEVMEKVARRRLQVSLLMTIPPVLIAAVLLWALVPVIQPLAETVAQGVWPAVPAAILAVVLALISWQVAAPNES